LFVFPFVSWISPPITMVWPLGTDSSVCTDRVSMGGAPPATSGVPGLLTAKCTSNENASGYLEVTVNGNPSDPRVDDIVGDIGNPPNILANWGLHLIDVNLAMGNLVDIVAQEAKAYAKKK